MNLTTAMMISLLSGPAGIETANVIDRGAQDLLSQLRAEARIELKQEIREDVHEQLRQRMEDATAEALAEAHRDQLVNAAIKTDAKGQ
ncbi:MAG: hypothetical protein AAGA23_15340 [Pseudomonadota bacterium]